ncbi:MAG: hypothetical protein CL610_27395 [Anaerolineaceae bacterium]|nr:hypothetical protein [Anaerolineaceae bacterium]
MYVKINRNVCDHQLAICERCLGRFLDYPLGYERQCFEELRDDGSDLLTIELHTGDRDLLLVLDANQRHLLAGEGWAKFMNFAVPTHRQKTEKPS